MDGDDVTEGVALGLADALQLGVVLVQVRVQLSRNTRGSMIAPVLPRNHTPSDVYIV